VDSAFPPGTPGSAAPRRAQLLGAAVRRSMAAQAQQLGTGAIGGASSRGGNTNSSRTASGRHARGEAGGTTGRQIIRLNERGFGRLRDA
jgi:hypothetical protein